MRTTVLLFTIAFAAAACSRSSSESAPTSAASTSATGAPAAHEAPSAQAAAPASPSAAEGLRWDDPPRWKRRSPSTPMRKAEYVVPRAGRDTEDAECTVLTFGRGQGGDVQANADRWARQFSPMSGSPSRGTREVHGMKVTRIEVAGTYHPMQMPGGPSGPASVDNARLIGDIVEAPNGLWFFKLTGPDATVRGASDELDKLVSSAAAQ